MPESGNLISEQGDAIIKRAGAPEGNGRTASGREEDDGDHGEQESMRKNMKESLIRLAILFGGLVVAHLGVTLFLLADLGSDPFNVLIQGLRLMVMKVFPIAPTHGTVHMAACFLIILILLLTDRSYVKAGTVVCMFCGGPIIDFFTWILGGLGISDASLPVKIPVLILGCAILAFGMSIVIRSEAGTGPNDLVAVVISDALRYEVALEVMDRLSSYFQQVLLLIQCIYLQCSLYLPYPNHLCELLLYPLR